MVITTTSLCATWDISWASTPSSSLSSSRLISPVVTTSTAFLLLRPVANAFGMSVCAIATRGLDMSASAHSRSMIPCSCGACSGVTSCAPDARSATLSDQNREPNTSTAPRTTAKKMMAPAPCFRAISTKTSAVTKATKTSPSRNIVKPIRACSPLSGA